MMIFDLLGVRNCLNPSICAGFQTTGYVFNPSLTASLFSTDIRFIRLLNDPRFLFLLAYSHSTQPSLHSPLSAFAAPRYSTTQM